jgi:hypothetical protein
VEASAPITATEVSAEPSGSTLPLFLSRTVPSAASSVEVAWWAAVVAVAPGEPLGALSNMPNANISVSTWVAMESSVAWLTVPAATAFARAVP